MADRKALILGATGGIGGEMMRTLTARGWAVTALHRKKKGVNGAGVTWIKGDAVKRKDVLRAAEGVSTIIHAVNPPGYRHWGKLVLPMVDNTIAAARANNARIVLPGTVYNFGPDALPVFSEESPQHPTTRKGAIRVALERRLEEASSQGASVLIVRAGDFFGPRGGSNWFAQGLVKPGRPVGSMTYPGKKGVGKQWAYLPDVAETMARLLERDGLPAFARFHMKGHWDEDGTQMIAAIRRVVGNPRLKVKAFPWPLVRLASPVMPLFRELLEMRYLWQVPVFMDNTALVSLLGHEPHTDWDDAVRTTLAGLGCL